MGGMIAVVILALLMVPVFFVSVQRVLAGDREKVEEAASRMPRRLRRRRHEWQLHASRSGASGDTALPIQETLCNTRITRSGSRCNSRVMR